MFIKDVDERRIKIMDTNNLVLHLLPHIIEASIMYFLNPLSNMAALFFGM